ncbi:MAG: DUF4838 domain-containing protein [Lentisphaeria bacterium]|nr:DUF4838 domain-containing protein [Lentisphaeria bacterium]
MKRSCVIFAALFALCSLSAATLVRNGKAESYIVIPEKAQPSVVIAAEELAYHVKKASGAVLPVYRENAVPAQVKGTPVYLGDCRVLPEKGIDTSKLKPAAFIIRAKGNELIIAGRDRDTGPVGSSWHAVWHGTLWGVYEFLETELGVLWIWADESGEVIPKTQNIIIKDKELTAAPKLRFTDLTAREPKPDFAKRYWINPENAKLFWEKQSRFLLRHRIGSVVNMNYSHEFGHWWRWYGKKHPEYFALTNSGKRGPLPETPDGWGWAFVDMCISNPAFHQQILKDWARRPARLKQLRPYICVGLNDFPIMCICENCRAWDQKDPRFAKSPYWGKGKVLTFKERWAVAKAAWGEEGTTADDIPSLSDRHARFLLAVQKLANKQYPGVPVVAFAYANYRKPPTEVKLNDGIIILNTAALFFPYTDITSRDFRKEWMGWRDTGVLLHYRPNLLHAGGTLPVFYARRFADDFKFAYQNGMISSQMDSFIGTFANQAPNNYAVLRLHSDPERDSNEVLEDFYRCFGPAYKEVKAYFSFWEKCSDAVTAGMWDIWQKRNRTASGLGGTFKNFIAIGPEYLTPKVLKQGKALLAKAVKAAAKDKESAARVAFLVKGLKEAELAVAVRRAQIRMEKEKTPAAKAAFKAAWKKLNDYRREIEGDCVIDTGKMRFRENTGLRWPLK